MTRTITILIHEWVTGGGLAGSPLPESWAREGNAMRRAIARDFASIPTIPTRVIMTLDSRLPREPGPWEILPVEEGGEIETVMCRASRADYTLIIAPETDGILADWAARLERPGIRSLGSNAESIALTGDKLAFARHLRDRGIATPPARLVEGGAIPSVDLPFPAVLKPIDGAGSLDTYLIDTPEQLAEIVPSHPWGEMLAQPYVPGDALSASYLVDVDGNPHRIGIGRQAIAIRENRFQYLGGEIPAFPDLDDGPLRSAIRAIAGLRGYLGVDFVRDRRTGDLTVIEINPRATTSTVGLCRLLPPGRLAGAWLAACGGPGANNPEIFRHLADRLANSPGIAFTADGTFLPRTAENP